MKHIFNKFDIAFDLGNVKSVELKSKSNFNGYPCDWYIQIELLNGKEFIYNPDTGGTELVNPIININSNSGESADFMYKEIIKEWEKYLKSKEEEKIKNKE